jgi:DNA-binding transcriptional LysR family regulator
MRQWHLDAVVRRRRGTTAMELRQLRYFVALAEEGHFGRAAERLRIAQPGLSQQIKVLERSVGTPLVDRYARPIALTAAGSRLLPHARAMLEAASRAVDATRDGEGPGATLKIGVTAIGNYPEFSSLVETFTDRAPDVDVRVLPSMSDAMVDALLRRSLDVGAAHQPIDWPEVAETPRYLRLGDQEVLIVLPADHPLTRVGRIDRDDLLEERVIGTPQDLAPKFAQHVTRILFGVYPHPHAIDVPGAIDRDSRFRMVAEGKGLAGIAIPANTDPPSDRDGVVFRRVADPPALIEYGLFWFDVNASQATESFIEVARSLPLVDIAEPAEVR